MITLDIICLDLDGYRHLCTAQADVKAALSAIITHEPQYSNQDCIEALLDNLPPEVI